MSNLLEYKCPCCGGAISFDSTLQKMKCPYCDTEFDVETLQNYDQVLNNTAEETMHWDSSNAGSEWSEGEQENMRVYVCNSCGGTIIGDLNTAATSCPYCGNPVVMTNMLAGDLKPDYIIPFRLNKEAAIQGLKKHLTGKRLLPKIFKDENHINEIKGMYVPFWLFSTDANANINYAATKSRTWSDRNYIYTETSHYSVYRAGSLSFDSVPVDGSAKIADNLMQSIEPFNMSDAVDFQTAYLAGYFADKYDVDLDACIDIANERIKRSTETAFASTVVGYESVLPQSSSVNFSNGIAKYALYPVWFLNTTWNGQQYSFAMNGQTGKFVGDLPVDKGKATWMTFLIGLISSAAIFGIAWALKYFGIF